MRTIPGTSLAKLVSAESIEPINIVSIKWGNGAPTNYSDKIILGGIGRILEMGAINDAQRSDSSGTTGAVSIKLDDIDGSLKTIYNTTDIHLKPVNVYQTFNELGLEGKFLVLSGQISSPIVWDEGERTLSFDIVTKIEDREVGWSAEMGDFSLVSQELLGKAWPIVFGTVQHIPALQLQNIPTAFTTEAFLVTQSNSAYDKQLFDLGFQFAKVEQERIKVNLDILQRVGLDFTFDPMDYPEYKSLWDQGVAILDEITLVRQEQAQNQASTAGFVRSSVPLIPTVNITQPFKGIVRVGNNFFTARMSNLTGTLNCTPVNPPGPIVLSTPNATDQYYDIGTQVVIADNYPIEFVVSTIPGTVLRVWAMRNFNGLKKMTVVPPKFYTISVKNYGGQEATIVTLKKPLSTISQQANFVTQNWESNFGQYMAPHVVNQIDWEDQIYVTFQSSVGPNPVDIMEYLINTYTSNGFDTASFNHVKTILARSPMNFMLDAQPNVMDLLVEIAYQARCIIFLRDDVFYLIFLPEIPTPIDTITEDDIIVGSMVITSSTTESLVTKYTATYKPDYSPEFSEPVKVILRYNINKYGMHPEAHDFTMFNTYYATEHAAVFWMIRKSNTWKILKAKLFITKLNLEVFDAVTLSFESPHLAKTNVVGIITSCSYNSSDHTIDVEIWTPIRLGEMVPYKFAWPAGLTKQDIFPTYRDVQSGSTGGTSGGQQLPNANASRPEVGKELGGLDGRSNWTTGPAFLGEEDQFIPEEDPEDQQNRYTPVPEGGYRSVVQSTRRTFITPEDYNPTGVFPAKILEYVGPVENSANIFYKCEQYLNGLEGKPQVGNLQCLQIDPDDRIPEGTWVIGCNAKYANPEYTGSDDVQHAKYKYERFFSIPIWLG